MQRGDRLLAHHRENGLRLSLALFVSVLAVCGVLLPAPAKAQGSGAWAFCYVDPPTFQSGNYVYTRTIYVGTAPIPKAEIAAAMVQASPQVASRPISCWRYSSQVEAESRRREGMTLDRGRGYSVLEISWASPYSPESEPAQASAETPETSPVQAVADTPPASKDSSPPPPKPAASKAAPAKPQWEVEYEAKMAAYERELARQKAAVAEFQRAQAELERSRAEQAERARKARAEWETNVAACKAGDHSKCAKTGN